MHRKWQAGDKQVMRPVQQRRIRFRYVTGGVTKVGLSCVKPFAECKLIAFSDHQMDYLRGEGGGGGGGPRQMENNNCGIFFPL